MSVKRKRISLCRIPSSSSDDGTAAPLTESDLSDSISADSRSLSAGEEEPPTKRKRDKALKTAAERNRKSGRIKPSVAALSPKSSAMHQIQHEETALAPDVDNSSGDENAERNCIPNCNDDSAVNNCSSIKKGRQHSDKPSSAESVNKHTQGPSATVVSEDSATCLAEHTAAVTADKTTGCESASSAQQDSVGEVDSAAVAGKKECSDADSVPDGKSLEDESSEKKEFTGDKQNSCTAEATDVVPVSTSSESSVQAADNTVLNGNCCEDKRVNDEQSTDTESHHKNDEACKSHDGTRGSDGAEVSAQSGTHGDESNPGDKSVSNGHPTCVAKKMRGRPRKSNKKRRKKREHSNVAGAASVTEVQETDYEPTKKLGRPSKKKSKLAQLAAEACDSVPQSEDDIPLIELRQAAEDDIPLIELRRSSRANKGQRKLDQLILDQPKKRNRAKDEKERKRAEKEEKRQKREAELQEQAALKARKVSNRNYSSCILSLTDVVSVGYRFITRHSCTGRYC